MSKDRSGRSVAVGNKVRLLSLNPLMFEFAEDQEELLGLVGQEFDVMEVNGEYIGLEKTLEEERGVILHQFTVTADEIERVDGEANGA